MSETADARPIFEEKILGLLNELFGAALRLAKNRDDAEDLVAETVLKAWENRADLRDEGKFRSWIFRILNNTFISHCRKKTVRSRTEPLTDNVLSEEEKFSLFEELHQPFLLWWSNPEKEFLNKIFLITKKKKKKNREKHRKNTKKNIKSHLYLAT